MDFKNFIEGAALVESLNSPQEFYMTDDTKLPMQVHAAFAVDGDENSMYVMSLVQSKTAGMYILDVGRTPKGGGKSYYWKFHSPSDLRPVLSTLVKFVETSMQLLGPKLKGIAVRFRMANTKMMEVSERIATKMIKKSYMKSMKIVPVKQPEVESKKNKAGEKGVFYGKTQRYLFIAKKIVAPATIFKAKNFKTLGYNFDLTKGLTTKNPLPYETLAELQPKVVVKPVKSVTPSKKYVVAGASVALTNNDVMDLIADVDTKNTVSINSKEEKAKELEKAKKLSIVKPASTKETVKTTSVYDFDTKTAKSINDLWLNNLSYDRFSVFMAIPAFDTIREEIRLIIKEDDGKDVAIKQSITNHFINIFFKLATKMDIALLKEVGMIDNNGNLDKSHMGWCAKRYYEYESGILKYSDAENYKVDTIKKVRSNGDEESKKPISTDDSNKETKETDLQWVSKPATMPEKIAALVNIPNFALMIEKLHQHGFQESKYSEENLKYIMSGGKGLTFSQNATLEQVGLNPNMANLSDPNAWRDVMKAIASYSSLAAMKKQNEIPIKKMGEWFSSDNVKKLDGVAETTFTNQTDFLEKHTILKSTTITAEALHDTINDDPFGSIALPGKTHRRQWDQEDNFANDEKVESFLMDHFGKSMENLKYDQREAIHRYTSSSTDVNNALREIYDKVLPEGNNNTPVGSEDIKKLTAGNVDGDPYSSEYKIRNLLQVYQDLPTTPENMWVYRGTDAPYNPPLGVSKSSFRENLVPGELYWDGGFMSTSIRANIDFGSQIRFRFYIPKGTPMIPMLTHTYSPTHYAERELVLPPGSVFKIIERNSEEPWETSDRDTSIFITAVYIGSIHHDVKELAISKHKA